MAHDLKHLAIIMDGNARWAKERDKNKAEGHRKGAETAKKLLPFVADHGIEYLTLYAFSSENWQRPPEEVSILINLLSYYVKHETKILVDNGIRLKVIGNLDMLTPILREKIDEVVNATEHNSKLTVSIAFSYGGREEISNACQKAIDAGEKIITPDILSNYLYDPDMPDVDLLIRPSGVYRISNFLLWQIAYAELYFINKYWPDFNEGDLIEAIEDFSKRKRNFGIRP